MSWKKFVLPTVSFEEHSDRFNPGYSQRCLKVFAWKYCLKLACNCIRSTLQYLSFVAKGKCDGLQGESYNLTELNNVEEVWMYCGHQTFQNQEVFRLEALVVDQLSMRMISSCIRMHDLAEYGVTHQSKFGQRMLEKMGWKNGKGLGAHEDGKTDHIKVSLKNNTLGVGCSASHDDNWIAHQDDFNDILANLNQDHGKEEDQEGEKKEMDEANKSLEERSKKSKSRVHYKKFTRGKDLSKYGNTDINCILGVRASKSASSTPQTQSINNSENEDEDDKGNDREEKEDTSHGITTITHTTSVQDYFAKKMADLKRARLSQQLQSSENDTPRSECTEASNVDGDSIEHKDKKCKKKKKNKKKKDIEGNQECDISHPDMEVEDTAVESKKLKKRKQRDGHDSEDSSEGMGQGNKSSSSEEAQTSHDSPRKKKCKRKSKGKEMEVVSVGDDDSEQTSTSGFVSKKSKKKKKSKGIEDL